jgi:hypothetical protein
MSSALVVPADITFASSLAHLMPPADPPPEARDVSAAALARVEALLRPRETVSFTLEGPGSWTARTFDPDDPNPESCSVVARGPHLAGAISALLALL